MLSGRENERGVQSTHTESGPGDPSLRDCNVHSAGIRQSFGELLVVTDLNVSKAEARWARSESASRQPVPGQRDIEGGIGSIADDRQISIAAAGGRWSEGNAEGLALTRRQNQWQVQSGYTVA